MLNHTSKIRVIIFMILTGLFYPLYLIGQGSASDFGKLKSITPNAPTTAGLGIFGSYPMDLVNGLPNISIPITEYSSGSLEENISLNYHADGIKVKERASWTGLGWSLFSGGAISVSVNGKPDLYGYFQNSTFIPQMKDRFKRLLKQQSTPAAIVDSTMMAVQTLNKIIAADPRVLLDEPGYDYGGYDFMPDTYQIINSNVAGNFVFNSEWKPQMTDGTLPFQVKELSKDTIIYAAGGTVQKKIRKWIYGFTVVDSNGNIYTFGGIDATSSNSAVEVTLSYSDYEEYWKTDYAYISAYYLTKIVSADGLDSVLYKYEPDVVIADTIFTYSIYKSQQCEPLPKKHFQTTETHTIKLSEILFTNGKLIFNRSVWNPEEDSRLDNIILYSKIPNGNYKQIERIDFKYGVFNNIDNSQTLKLTGLEIKGSDNVIAKDYRFGYNTLPLPGRKSHDLDHWGYYNGAGNPGKATKKDNSFALCPRLEISVPVKIGPNVYQNDIKIGVGKRDTNPLFTQACMLDTIWYPSKGYTLFEYENHKDDNNKIYGGLRIKTITNFENGVATSKKSFEYSGGYTLGFTETSLGDYYRTYIKDCGANVPSTDYANVYETVLHNNANGIYQNQSVLAYTQVTEKDVNVFDNTFNGKTIYTYNSTPDWARSDMYSYEAKYLWSPYQSLAFTRRQVKTSVLNNNNQLVKETENIFIRKDTIIASGFQVVRDFFLVEDCCSSIPDPNTYPIRHSDFSENYVVQNYPVFQVRYLVDSTIQREFSNGQVLNEVTKYTYSSATSQYDGDYQKIAWHPFPIRIETTKSNLEKSILVRRYPLDFYIPNSNSPNYLQLYALKAKHMISPIINETHLINDEVIGSATVEYLGFYPKTTHFLHSLSRIEATSLFEQLPINIIPSGLTSLMEPEINFSYSLGRLISQQKVDDVPKSYCWGYNNTHLTAEVINATPDEVAFISYEYGLLDFIVSDDAHTGDYCSKIAVGQTTGFLQKHNLKNRTYKYSAWVKASANGYIKIIDLDNPQNDVQIQLPETDGKWQYIEAFIAVHDGANVHAYISNAGNADSFVYVDDVRFCPNEAIMTTYTYLPLVGITSITDNNNLISYFEYDSFRRLRIIRDDKKNILKQFEYHYQKN